MVAPEATAVPGHKHMSEVHQPSQHIQTSWHSRHAHHTLHAHAHHAHHAHSRKLLPHRQQTHERSAPTTKFQEIAAPTVIAAMPIPGTPDMDAIAIGIAAAGAPPSKFFGRPILSCVPKKLMPFN
jgi:hypothetical protein